MRLRFAWFVLTRTTGFLPFPFPFGLGAGLGPFEDEASALAMVVGVV